jgi:hypothetical protein
LALALEPHALYWLRGGVSDSHFAPRWSVGWRPAYLRCSENEAVAEGVGTAAPSVLGFEEAGRLRLTDTSSARRLPHGCPAPLEDSVPPTAPLNSGRDSCSDTARYNRNEFWVWWFFYVGGDESAEHIPAKGSHTRSGRPHG